MGGREALHPAGRGTRAPSAQLSAGQTFSLAQDRRGRGPSGSRAGLRGETARRDARTATAEGAAAAPRKDLMLPGMA